MVNKYFFEEMNKMAGVGKVFVLAFKHPKTTLGLIGGGALSVGAIGLANKLHGAYVMQNEARKRGIMKQQRSLLQQLVINSKRENPKEDPRRILINHLVKQ